MKANQRCRLRAEDAAVSSVIGAILVTALVFSLLLTIRLSFVPVWDKNAAQTHLIGVERQLATIKTEIDRQVDNRTANSLTNTLTLVPERVSIFQGAPSSHRVEFANGGADARVSSTLLLVLVNNGLAVTGLNPDWEPADDTLVDVESVESLRVRFNVTKPDGGPPGPSTDRIITLDVDDASGNDVGRLQIRWSKTPPDHLIVTSTFQAGSSTPLASVSDVFHESATFQDYFVNALDPNLLFNQLLASAEAPFTITMTQVPDVGATYTVAYNQATGTGTVLVGNTGVEKPNYNATYTGGTLVYSASNPGGVDQTYVLENGALILAQGDGATFRVPPSFSVARVGSMTALNMVLPSLSGDGTSLSGSANVKVTSTSIVASDTRGVAPMFRVQLNTSYPELWAEFWTQQFEAASLTNDTHYTVTNDTTSATFTLYGTNLDDTKKDVSVRIKQARVAVALQG